MFPEWADIRVATNKVIDSCPELGILMRLTFPPALLYLSVVLELYL